MKKITTIFINKTINLNSIKRGYKMKSKTEELDEDFDDDEELEKEFDLDEDAEFDD